MFVLASPALCGEHAAAMDIFEIAVWEFVIPSTFFAVFVVDCQEPFAVFEKPILFDVFILGLRGGMVVAPSIPFVIDKLTLPDKSHGVFICAVIELHGHAADLLIGSRPRNPSRRSARARGLLARAAPCADR